MQYLPKMRPIGAFSCVLIHVPLRIKKCMSEIDENRASHIGRYIHTVKTQISAQIKSGPPLK